MRIINAKHLPWFIFVCLATIGACILYVGNFYPARLPLWLRLPPSLLQTPTQHQTVGGTPLGLAFGAISLGIFVFAALLSLRKRIPFWRAVTVRWWLRAHIWLTLLTIPLVILHSGFRLGGPMTTLLMAMYAVVMVSGIYGLILQHFIPTLMLEWLPAETVFEQIPHIRAQLAAAAEKMRHSFLPTPPKKTDADAAAPNLASAIAVGASAMVSTKGNLSTPTARAKTAVGSTVTAEPLTTAAATSGETIEAKAIAPIPTAANSGAITSESPKAVAIPRANVAETIGAPTARVQSEPGAGLAATPASSAQTPRRAAPPVPDPASEAILAEFIEDQILPYLRARNGKKLRLGNERYADDTFRFLKLQVAETYRTRVEEIQAWCDERRMLDLQTRLHHWLHGWLFIHVPVSVLLLLMTGWHAFETLFSFG